MTENDKPSLENEPANHTNGDGNGESEGSGLIALADPVEAPRAGLAVSERAAFVAVLNDHARDGRPDDYGLKKMPPVGHLESEPRWKRWLFVCLALAFLFWPRSMTWHNGPVGYFQSLMAYWAPAHPGINQNGYLVGGKFLAYTGTMGFKPTEPYVFLGWMWNLVERTGADGKTEIWYYPKYPIGNSALFAGCIKAAQYLHYGSQTGKIWSFYVNPVCMTLAMLATFLLVRLVAGSFAGFCGMVILSFSQVTLQFADQPLSHGPALCAVTWGIYFLARWWQTASIWRGLLAGLFLGYAVTTRYTEGLLVIPLAAATLCMIRYRPRETRWVSLSIWLAIMLVGAIGYVGFNRWPSKGEVIAAICVAGLLLAAVPILTGEFKTFAVTDEDSDDVSRRFRASRIVDYVNPLEMRRNLNLQQIRERWLIISFHILRVAIAAAIVWAAFFVVPPIRPDTEEVARTITIIIFKAGLAGALAMLYLIPWSRPRSYLSAAVPAIAWLIPVGILVGYNWFAMHSVSGYDTTNESTAFTWKMFTEKWDDTVQQVYDYSIFLVPPLAIVGMFMMFRRNWRAGLIVTLWFVPGFLLYTSYYFGQQRPGMWYLRFFLTLFPPMVMGAMWLVKSAAEGATLSDRDRELGRVARGSVAAPLAIGALTFASAAIGLQVSISSMEREAAANTNLAYTCDRIVSKIPLVQVNGRNVEPVVFADGRDLSTGHLYPLNNMLQFAGDFELYASDAFSARPIGWRGDVDSSAPNPLQAKRQEYQMKLFRGKSDADMVGEQNRIMRNALAEGRPVFAVLPTNSVGAFKRFITEDFAWKLIDQWKEPAKVPFARSGGALDPNARGMPLYNSRSSQAWQMYEITRKPKPKPVPATPAPATQPTTKPAESTLAVATPTVPSPTATPTTTPAEQKQLAAAPPATQPAQTMTLTDAKTPIDSAQGKQAAPATLPTVVTAPAPTAVAAPAVAPPATQPMVAPTTQPKTASAPTTLPTAVPTTAVPTTVPSTNPSK